MNLGPEAAGWEAVPKVDGKPLRNSRFGSLYFNERSQGMLWQERTDKSIRDSIS